MHSHISSCINNYSREYLALPDDVIFRLYLYSYEEVNKEKSHLCAPNHFLKTSSYGDIWSNILLSTGLADVFGIEQQDYKLNVSEALDNVYACLVLIGKYILCKPKFYKKADSLFWHTVDRMLRAYEADKRAKSTDDEKIIIADYLKLDFHYKSGSRPKWLVCRKSIPEEELLSDKRKDEIIDIIQKIASNFDALTSLDKLDSEEKRKKADRDTMGKEKNHIRFPPYLAPIIRGSYVSVHAFPYLPNENVYKAYKKYEDIYDTDLGIDEKTYVCLKRIVRYKDYVKNANKNTKIPDSLFLKKYFSVLYGTIESLDKQDLHGIENYYNSSYISAEQFMENKAYYYLTEKIYGYYLFRHETQLIKEQTDDLDSLSHEKKRLLKQALTDIFLCCPGIFARLQAADEAMNFIFGASNELMILDSYSKYDGEKERMDFCNRDIAKQNSLELQRIIDKFSYEHFAENEDKAITSLLIKIYPEKIESSIEELILDKMKKQIKEFKDKTGMMDYYKNCKDGYYIYGNKVGGQEHIDDNPCKRKKENKSYRKILCWVIKKSVGDKWYDFFEQIEE